MLLFTGHFHVLQTDCRTPVMRDGDFGQPLLTQHAHAQTLTMRAALSRALPRTRA